MVRIPSSGGSAGSGGSSAGGFKRLGGSTPTKGSKPVGGKSRVEATKGGSKKPENVKTHPEKTTASKNVKTTKSNIKRTNVPKIEQSPVKKKTVSSTTKEVVEKKKTVATTKPKPAKKEISKPVPPSQPENRGVSHVSGKVAPVEDGEFLDLESFEDEDNLSESDDLFDSVVSSALDEKDTTAKKKTSKKAKNKKKSKGSKILKFIVVPLILLLVLVLGFGFLNKNYLNPKTNDVEDALSGSYSLTQWASTVNSGNTKALESEIPGSYLSQEADYAGSEDIRQEFYKRVMATVKYEIPEIQEVTESGRQLKAGENPKMITSDLMAGEKVNLTYIDWSKVNFSKEQVKKTLDNMDSKKITTGGPDASYAMQDLFANLVVDFLKAPNGGIPLKTVEWEPSLESYPATDSKGEPAMGMKVSKEEDKRIDELLFGSKDFLAAQATFAANYLNKPIPDDWSNYIEDEEGKVPMPSNYKNTINPNWIGAYRLQEGIVKEGEATNTKIEPILPPNGEGSKENPAGLNTSIKTSYMVDGKAMPVRVELIDFKKDQDAVDYYQSKDARNRGFTVNSQRKYVLGKLKVTNLYDKDLTIEEDTAISDDQLNITNSTGTVYGLNNKVKLKSGETGELEFWASGPDISNRYLIWGKSFDRKQPAVWFRVLGAEDGTVDAVKGGEGSDAPGASASAGINDAPGASQSPESSSSTSG